MFKVLNSSRGEFGFDFVVVSGMEGFELVKKMFLNFFKVDVVVRVLVFF